MAEFSLFDSFAKGSNTTLSKKGSNCVIYTRVSTKEQADNNLSLETQRKACNQYASKFGYTVLANFGGTYESAQTDERHEFSSMISYVRRCREKVSHIIVYSLERFSRNDNSIWLSGELRKLGIEIISVTQPIDTSNPSGQMQQKMLFLFGEFDNQLRKQKCMAGIKEMLLRGDWPTMAPLGYDSIKVNGKRKIVINAKGKLLKQAFVWKAQDKLSNETIRQKLFERGLKLNHQRISEIFRNPFYCGLMAHNMLEGKLQPGNHEQLVSKEIFLKVNGLLDENAHGYKLIEENDAIPLKRFLRCDNCGKPLKGYIVKKKNIYYYKCSTIGCCNNRSADFLNTTFKNILKNFNLNVSEELKNVIKNQTIATYNQLTKTSIDEYELLEKAHSDLCKKIGRLEERFIEEQIDNDLYYKYSRKYLEEKREMEGKLLKGSKQLSNLDECIEMALAFASKMASKWDSAEYSIKQKIQYLLFPEGIYYNRENDSCRTNRVNSVFSYVAYFQQLLTQQKRGIPELNLDFASFAGLVARTGIEPMTFGL